MKKIILFTVLILGLSSKTFPQWQNMWTSPSISDQVISGYLSFEKNGDTWNKRIYYLDAEKFFISSSPTDLNPQYTYYFTDEEIAAGYQLYSLQTDLTGDGITEFYVLGYVGTSTDYRRTVKIFDITNNNIVFQKNDPAFSYSYPTIIDVNGDGTLECLIYKYNYPYDNQYYLELYSTGVTSNQPEIIPLGFTLEQNYPNPFNVNSFGIESNNTTSINFNLAQNSNVRLNIYSITGELISTIINDNLMAGNHSVKWNGIDSQGRRVPAGVYLYELNTGGAAAVKKMLLLK